MTATTNTGWDKDTSPFHEGELAIQERLGVRDKMDRFGRRVVRSYLPEQHREFHGSLPLLFLGHVDDDGNVWASAVAGEPGFFHSPDPGQLRLDARPLAGDPLAASLRPGLDLGMLGIELSTRRRNRVNGHVSAIDNAGITIAVDQTFGNCPQYIQTRRHEFVRDPRLASPNGVVEEFHAFDAATAEFIRGADTLWVASASHNSSAGDGVHGADVSHRGGRPGFVKVDGNTLTIPDYAGNLHFNTLGNFMVNPRAGLLFIDFASGDVIMLTGTAEVLFDGPEVDAFRGAERAWRFVLERGVRLVDALPLRWEFDAYSPNTLITGDWAEAESVLAAEALRDTWRPYRVARIDDESDEIRSFYLEPADDTGLVAFAPGQYLTIRVSPDGSSKQLVRTYTLSSAPSDEHYRISVKREAARGDHPAGAVSNQLHDRLAVGDRLEARAPRGDFFIDPAERRPAVLLAAGVGVTPMISMARAVAHEGLRTRHRRPLTVFHGARTTAARAFADDFRALERDSGGTLRYVSAVSAPGEGESAGEHFDVAGRIDAAVLRAHLALDDYDWFVCGPPAFMQAAYDAARSLGVPDRRIFAEAFGPASLQRRPDEGAAPAATLAPEADQSLVRFGKSNFEQRWDKGDKTLLELAEDHGLSPDYGCRGGSCGTCAIKVTGGAVTYRTPPTASVGADEALICCAVPASETVELAL